MNKESNTPESREYAKDLARLNDALRRNGIGGKVYITQGVEQLSSTARGKLMIAIAAFNYFIEDNDPYGEHDFGEVTFEGTKYFWKIDYYNEDLQALSPNPLDQSVTRRVIVQPRF